MGYHLVNITQGKVGELSKIQEELDEAKDAENNDNPVMLLVELSDIIGAIECYLEANFDKTITLQDLVVMARATNRAFKSGARKCKTPLPQ